MKKLDVFLTRFSTEMQRSESCDDQEREVRAGLKRMGVAYSDPLVLRDEAESGLKCVRHVFAELMSLVRAGRVRLLAVDDQARFSRADHAFTLINDVVFHGGRFISTGEGIDTNQEGWQLRVKVMELHNSTTIRELGRRVRRGQKGRVLDHNGAAGDHCFGYRSEYTDPNWVEALAARGPKPKKVVIIHEPEARIVRLVFALFGDGNSISSIVRKLNAEKIPKGFRSTKPDWDHHHVRRILGNAKYVGLWTWGSTVTVRDSLGRKRQIPAATDQVVTVKRPDLRIIDDESWQKTQGLLHRLNEVYGKKPHEEPRAARIHHTELYPASLLGGLMFCDTCGARMTIQQGNGRKYLGCSKHRRGTCPMVARVPMDRAEKAVVNLISSVLTTEPTWVDAVLSSMRNAIIQSSRAVPDALAADERRLKDVQRKTNNLLEAVENGLDQSLAVSERLSALEAESEILHKKIGDQRNLIAHPVELPDDAWVRNRLAELAAVLNENTAAAATLLRRLLGKVTAHEISIRGKKRGYPQLRLRIDAFQALVAALGDRVSGIAVAVSRAGVSSVASPEFTIDLGRPSRMDQLAPKIAELRQNGIAWNEISRITGLSTGNAWTAWKRWAAANLEDSTAA